MSSSVRLLELLDVCEKLKDLYRTGSVTGTSAGDIAFAELDRLLEKFKEGPNVDLERKLQLVTLDINDLKDHVRPYVVDDVSSMQVVITGAERISDDWVKVITAIVVSKELGFGNPLYIKALAQQLESHLALTKLIWDYMKNETKKN